ncbi:BtpA/SgcQ family protein, partial [Rhizobium ruizarguesonis]
TMEEIEEIGSATHLPLLVGSGVNKDNIVDILALTNGVIVSSSLKHGGEVRIDMQVEPFFQERIADRAVGCFLRTCPI